MHNYKLVVISINIFFFVFFKYDKNTIFFIFYEICMKILEFCHMYINKNVFFHKGFFVFFSEILKKKTSIFNIRLISYGISI
jgi:hypothetical protein